MPVAVPSKLTKQTVDRLKPRDDRDYTVWCTELTGFGVRVWPTGKKVFIAQYRIGGRGSATRKVTVGSYGKLTTDEARTEAKRVLANAELGHDIALERTRKKAELTVAELCDEYMLDGVEHKKPSTLRSDKSRINRHIKPLLGRKKIGEVKRGDIERFMRDVAQGKTATGPKTGKTPVTGGKGAATRTVGLLGGIFTYAVTHGYIADSPCEDVKRYPDNQNERFLSPAELQRLGDTLRLAETEGLPTRSGERKGSYRPTKDASAFKRVKPVLVSPHAIACIRLLMFTGCRLSEILKLRWDDIDFERGILNLPDSKTGAKKVMLGAPALQVLNNVPRIKGNPYVIAGDLKDKHRSDLKNPWLRICEHAGLNTVGEDGKVKPLRLHDLRHSYASVSAEAGVSLLVIGKLLGHADPRTTQKYAHLADDPKRLAVERIAGSIDAMQRGQGGQVVPMTKAVRE